MTTHLRLTVTASDDAFDTVCRPGRAQAAARTTHGLAPPPPRASLQQANRRQAKWPEKRISHAPDKMEIGRLLLSKLHELGREGLHQEDRTSGTEGDGLQACERQTLADAARTTR